MVGGARVRGFFSYAHRDSKWDALEKLKIDIFDEYAVLTGDELELFFDKNSISWGDNWRDSIESGIDSASFFIPIITPQYFLSESCQKELLQYMAKVKELQEPGLILPIMYIQPTDAVKKSAGKLLEDVYSYQWIDCAQLRFVERGSHEYRLRVNQVAAQLMEVNSRLIQRMEDAADAPLADEEESGREEFYLESLDELNDLMPQFNQMVIEQAGRLERISDVMNWGTGQLEKAKARGEGVKGAITISVQVAQKLEPLSVEFENNAMECVSQVEAIDRKIRPVIKRAKQCEEDDPASKEMIVALGKMVESTRMAKGNTDAFIRVIRENANLSRALYEPSKRIEHGAVLYAGSCATVIGWENLLD